MTKVLNDAQRAALAAGRVVRRAEQEARRALNICRWGHEGQLFTTPEGWVKCRACQLEQNRAWRKQTLYEMRSDCGHQRHGTPSGYWMGCRCDRCIAANEAYTCGRITYGGEFVRGAERAS